MNLEKEIKKLKTYYVNSDITNKNFPEPKEIRTDFKIIEMKKSFSSKEALDEIKKQDCRPANIYELVKNADKLEKGKWYLALGSEFIDADGSRRVPYVYAFSDGGFRFNLGGFESDWDAGFCLLCFCDSPLPLSPLENVDSLTLDAAIALCKENGLKVIRIKTIEEEL